MKRKFLIFFFALAASAGTLFAQNDTGGNTNAVIGVFSVSKTRKVAFSPGNLQYNAAQGSHQCADGTTKPGTWRFAEHQWDKVGNGNSNISSTYDGWIDLFAWGTSGWDSGAQAYQPYSTSGAASRYRPGGSDKTDLTGAYAYADWGVYNQIGNDTPGTWRTLSKNEWYYLFYSRPNARRLFALGKVNGVNGVILLPDNWETPSGVSFVSSPDKGMFWRSNGYWDFSINHYFSDDVYTLEQWEVMESAGAVFLPVTGIRNTNSISADYSSGYYWSTTHSDEIDEYGQPYDAYYLWFYSTCCDPHHYYTPASRGMAVRLVSEKIRYLTISVEGNGSVSGEGWYMTGTIVTLDATPENGWRFDHWSDGNTDNPRTITVTKNENLTAVFVPDNTFLISFVNYDGTELQSSEVAYGETPVYTGVTPTKPADAQYTYTFSGWDAELVAVTGEATYTAQFTSTLNKYAITFVNYDGSELQNSEVAYGETPVYTGAIPTKPADAQYTYSFSGWDADIVAVTGEATYTAQFTSTLNKYAITFVNYDGTPLQSGEVEYGTVPSYTGSAPTKPADAQYTYTFSGWDAEIVAVTSEATYTAMFASLPIASSDSIFIHDGENPNLCDLGAQNFSHIIIEPGGELNINQSCVHVEAITIISTGVKSGQIHHGNNPIPTDRIFMEYVLNPVGANASPNLWYAFAVPFEVDIETGITRAYGNKNHVSGTDFLVKEFDGSLRATTGKGWKSKLTGTLEPGRFYVIGIEGNCNRWLFEKMSEAAFEGDNHMNIYYYSANNAKNNGWNGMGNTQLEYSAMDLSSLGIEYLLTYNSQFDKYDISLVSEASLCVGQPFFIQALTDGEFDFVHSSSTHNMPALYADRQAQNPLMHFTLADETHSTGIDHMYLTMHEDAVPSYTIGRDVARMSTTCTTAAQLWCTMSDGTQLSAHGIEIPTTSTTVNIELFAPTAGEYLMNMSSRAMEGYEVELQHNGAWVATLYEAQPVTLDLNAGINSGYALRITRHNMPTDIEGAVPSASSVNGEKRLIDGVLYILHNGRMYDAKGKQVK